MISVEASLEVGPGFVGSWVGLSCSVCCGSTVLLVFCLVFFGYVKISNVGGDGGFGWASSTGEVSRS